jgi:hypothetical protein
MISGEVYNPLDYGADPTGTTDSAPAIQAAIDAAIDAGGGEVFIPAGRYILSNSVKIQNTYTDNIYIKVRGVGSGNQSVSATSTYGSILVAQTGYIALDLAGGSNITLEDFGIIAGAVNPSTVGILMQRIQPSPYTTNIKFVRLGVGMGDSRPSANGGVGTIAIMNRRGEHHHHYDCWYYADKCVVLAGSGQYPAIVSPDYPEYVIGGATLSLNYFDNVAFLGAGYGNNIEAYSTFGIKIDGGYFLAQDGFAQILLSTFNQQFTVVDPQIEVGAGNPLCFVRAVSNVKGLTMAATTNISGLTGLRTVSGANVSGLNIKLGANFGQIFDAATESGGGVVGSVIQYDSSIGQSVPNNLIFDSVVLDGSVTGTKNIDIRTRGTTNAFSTGSLPATSSTMGTDTVADTTKTYICELFVNASTLITGAGLLQGSVGAGNCTLYLLDYTGNEITKTASFSVAGSTAQYVGNNFLTNYFATGPGKYYLAAQFDSASNRFRTHSLGFFGASSVTSTYGVLPTITPPTGFTANVGPIVSTY